MSAREVIHVLASILPWFFIALLAFITISDHIDWMLVGMLMLAIVA